MRTPQNQSTSNQEQDAVEFLSNLVSDLYIQLALVTEQLSSLTKILWSKGTLSDEELLVINDDMETLLERFRTVEDGDKEEE